MPYERQYGQRKRMADGRGVMPRRTLIYPPSCGVTSFLFTGKTKAHGAVAVGSFMV